MYETTDVCVLRVQETQSWLCPMSGGLNVGGDALSKVVARRQREYVCMRLRFGLKNCIGNCLVG